MTADEISEMGRHLAVYRRLSVPWSEYRKKISADLLLKWVEAVSECRRIGYVAPEGIRRGDVWTIRWHQVYDRINRHRENHAPMENLCSRCERECKRKDDKGIHKEGYMSCWSE